MRGRSPLQERGKPRSEQCDDGVGLKPQGRTLKGDLQSGLSVRIADERVRHAQSEDVQRAADADSEPSIAGSPQVLKRREKPRLQDPNAAHSPSPSAP
jgi:hypothetical protein